MRLSLALASAGIAGFLSLSPAQAFDDSLPYYAPWRSRTVHHHLYVPRHRHVYHFHGPAYRWAWREPHYRYKLGGYFVRNPDFRRLRIYR